MWQTFFASVHYYHLVPQLVRDPERSIGRHADPYGGDFLEQIAGTQKRTRDARLRRIRAALQVAVPQLSELKLEKDERGIPHLLGNYEHWRPQGAWQTEADFSDGTLRLMGLLWSLLEGSGPLLLEEPELSLHSEIVRYIPQMMLRVQRDRKRAARQVLMSTHSSDLLRDEGIVPDEVLLFIPSQEGSVVQVGADVDEVRQLLEAGLTAAEVVIPHTRPINAAAPPELQPGCPLRALAGGGRPGPRRGLRATLRPQCAPAPSRPHVPARGRARRRGLAPGGQRAHRRLPGRP